MVTFRTGALAPTVKTGSIAFRNQPFLLRQALTHDRPRQVRHVAAGRRVLRVLVVDHEQDTAGPFVSLVRRNGYAVRLADGLTTLRVAADQQPDVVLLDMEMPFVDGCQVARQLRMDFPRNECFIIATTGSADDASRQQSIQAGVDLLLIKPVDPSVVETLLLLESIRANQLHRNETGDSSC